jgi:hypothetical protein
MTPAYMRRVSIMSLQRLALVTTFVLDCILHAFAIYQSIIPIRTDSHRICSSGSVSGCNSGRSCLFRVSEVLKAEAYETLVSVVWSFSLPWLSMKHVQCMRIQVYVFVYSRRRTLARGHLCPKRGVAQRAGKEHEFNDVAGGRSQRLHSSSLVVPYLHVAHTTFPDVLRRLKGSLIVMMDGSPAAFNALPSNKLLATFLAHDEHTC